MPRLPRVSGAEAIRANDWDSSKFGNAGVTSCLSALDQTELRVVSFPGIRNLQLARYAES